MVKRGAMFLKMSTVRKQARANPSINQEFMQSGRNMRCGEIDRLSELPDELLVKVLSFLPTEEAVRMSLQSKRWEFLWMWLPKLEYDDSYYSVAKRHKLHRFINLNLPLHRSLIIESLRVKFCNETCGSIKPEDIKQWVLFVLSRYIRELSLELCSLAAYDTTLSSSLYICKSIVILELAKKILLDVPQTACLPSLKTLILRSVTYSDQKSLQDLLSGCPVLEDLVVERYKIDNLGTLSVSVKSLLRLTLRMSNPCPLDGVEIKTPAVEYLTVMDYRDNYDSHNFSTKAQYTYSFEDMPKLEEANLDFTYQKFKTFVRSIISVKRLELCLLVFTTSKPLYPFDIELNQLEHLKLCSCGSNWSFVLAWLLLHSRNLRDIEIFMNDEHDHDEDLYWEDQMYYVPSVCYDETLKTFKWIGMHGTEKEMEVAKYILRNGHALETVTILFHSSLTPEIKDRLSNELSLSFGGSTTCQLIFD